MTQHILNNDNLQEFAKLFNDRISSIYDTLMEEGKGKSAIPFVSNTIDNYRQEAVGSFSVRITSALNQVSKSMKSQNNTNIPTLSTTFATDYENTLKTDDVVSFTKIYQGLYFTYGSYGIDPYVALFLLLQDALKYDAIKSISSILSNHPQILDAEIGDVGDLVVDRLVKTAAENNSIKSLELLIQTNKYDATKHTTQGQEQLFTLIYESIAKDYGTVVLALMEYAEDQLSTLDKDGNPYIENFLNYAIKMDAAEVVIALVQSDAMQAIRSHYIERGKVEESKSLTVVLYELMITAVSNDAVKTFEKILELFSKETYFLEDSENITLLLEAIVESEAWKIAEFINENVSLFFDLQIEKNTFFQLYVAIKNDDAEEFRDLVEKNKLDLDEVEDIMHDIIKYDSVGVMQFVLGTLHYKIPDQATFKEYLKLAAASDSAFIFDLLLSMDPGQTMIQDSEKQGEFMHDLLKLINISDSARVLEVLISSIGNSENEAAAEATLDRLVSLALKMDFRYVVKWFFDNSYQLDRASNDQLVFKLLDIPIRKDDTTMVEYLVGQIPHDPKDSDEIARYNEILDYATVSSIKHESTNSFHRLMKIRDDIDINSPLNEEGQSALQIAIAEDQLQFFWHAVAQYINTEELKETAMSHEDANGKNLLHYALYYSGTVKVESFLEDILDGFGNNKIDHKDADGNTALIIAALTGNTAAFRILLENGADASIANNDGNTAAVFALSHYDYDTRLTDKTVTASFVEILKKYNVQLDKTAQFLLMAYNAANNEDHGLTIDMALNTPLNQAGHNSLQLALELGNLNKFWSLANNYVTTTQLKNMTVSHEDAAGKNLVHYAVEKTKCWGNGALLEELMNFFGNFSVDNPDKAGDSPLILAAKLHQVDAFNTLLMYGASPDATDATGHTAAFIALSTYARDPELGLSFLEVLRSYDDIKLDQASEELIEKYFPTNEPYSPAHSTSDEETPMKRLSDGGYSSEGGGSNTPTEKKKAFIDTAVLQRKLFADSRSSSENTSSPTEIFCMEDLELQGYKTLNPEVSGVSLDLSGIEAF